MNQGNPRTSLRYVVRSLARVLIAGTTGDKVGCLEQNALEWNLTVSIYIGVNWKYVRFIRNIWFEKTGCLVHLSQLWVQFDNLASSVKFDNFAIWLFSGQVHVALMIFYLLGGQNRFSCEFCLNVQFAKKKNNWHAKMFGSLH
jgi:hypothetical protein